MLKVSGWICKRSRLISHFMNFLYYDGDDLEFFFSVKVFSRKNAEIITHANNAINQNYSTLVFVNCTISKMKRTWKWEKVLQLYSCKVKQPIISMTNAGIIVSTDTSIKQTGKLYISLHRQIFTNHIGPNLNCYGNNTVILPTTTCTYVYFKNSPNSRCSCA